MNPHQMDVSILFALELFATHVAGSVHVELHVGVKLRVEIIINTNCHKITSPHLVLLESLQQLCGVDVPAAEQVAALLPRHLLQPQLHQAAVQLLQLHAHLVQARPAPGPVTAPARARSPPPREPGGPPGGPPDSPRVSQLDTISTRASGGSRRPERLCQGLGLGSFDLF